MRLVVLATLALALLATAAVEAQTSATIGAKEQGCTPAGGKDRTFCFDKDALTLDGGKEVTVTFQNTGSAPHSICFEDLPDGEKCTPNPENGTPGGAMSTVTFTTPAAGGTLPYYCKVPGHRSLGMEGIATITAGSATPPSPPPPATPPSPPPGGERGSPLPPLVFVAAGVVLLALALRPTRRE